MTSKRAAESASLAWGKDFYKISRWRNLRNKALTLYGERCHCCGAVSKKDKPLEVDHIKPRSKFPHLSFAMTNLQILCEKCNTSKGNRHQTDYRPHLHRRLAESYAANPRSIKSLSKERRLVERVGEAEAERRNEQKKLNRKKNRKANKISRKARKAINKRQVKFLSEIRQSVINGTVQETLKKYEHLIGAEELQTMIKRCNIGHWVNL